MKTKNYISLILIILPILLLAQNKVSQEISKHKANNAKFERLSVLDKNNNGLDSESKKAVKEATLANINDSELKRIVDHKYETIEIQVPYKGESITVELFKVEPFAVGFNVNTDQQKNIRYSKGVYYRGIVKGNDHSIAAFNFFNNEMNGVVSSSKLGNLNIGKLRSQSNQKQYIIYADNDLLIDVDFKCHTSEGASNANSMDQNRQSVTAIQKIVTTYLEVGYQAYQENGSDMTATLNWITSIFNNVQTLYSNDGISISLKTIFVWTVDDYYRLSGNYIIPAFTNIRPSFDGDIGFIADIDPAALGGQAFAIGALCTERNYAYGDVYLDFNSVPNYSKSVNFMAHELGHVLGAHHTQACLWNGNNTAIDGCAQSYGGCPTPVNPPDFQGTIMSYCSNLLFVGFGEQPANAIIQHINSANCLSADGGANCINTIGKIDALNVTQNTTTIVWTDNNSNNLEWDFSMVPYGSDPVFTTTNSNSHAFENLTPNTYYEVIVKGTCGNDLTYPKHSRVFATQGENCDGIQIFDTGGASGPYKINEHIIRTIVPTVPNKKIKITFNNVNLMPFDSQLYIYDGLDNNGPLVNRLSSGYPFRGSAQNNSATPSTIQSQHVSGALTLEFFSREDLFNTTVYNGWTATISCLNVLGNEEFGDGFMDYSFGPNPVTDVLKIKSKDIIKEVKVHTMDGKLLLSKKVSNIEVNLDLSIYKSDTYITTLFYEKTSASFKIIKE